MVKFSRNRRNGVQQPVSGVPPREIAVPITGLVLVALSPAAVCQTVSAISLTRARQLKCLVAHSLKIRNIGRAKCMVWRTNLTVGLVDGQLPYLPIYIPAPLITVTVITAECRQMTSMITPANRNAAVIIVNRRRDQEFVIMTPVVMLLMPIVVFRKN